MNDLLHLIQLWQNGSLPEDTILFGRKIFFWERTGELIQLIAGLFVIAEILGKERIQEFGRSIGGGRIMERFGEWQVVVVSAITGYLVRLFPLGPGMNMSLDTNPVIGKSSIKVVTLSMLLITSYYIVSLISVLEGGQNNPVVLVWLVYAFLASIFIIAILVFILYLLSLFGSAMNLIIFRPLAYILSKENINELFKIGSLLLFIIGFILSFMAM